MSRAEQSRATKVRAFFFLIQKFRHSFWVSFSILSLSKLLSKLYSSEHTAVEDLLDKQPVDFIIDFSSSTGIYNYGKAAASRGVKIISAISHYAKEDIAFLKTLAKETTVFWSPNITLGVNFLLLASKSLKKIAPYVDIEVIEEHFKQKQGVSGTAVKIAEALELKSSKINSIRAGGIVGKHEIIFGFPYQTVRLVHESISREAFGTGVLFAAHNQYAAANPQARSCEIPYLQKTLHRR